MVNNFRLLDVNTDTPIFFIIAKSVTIRTAITDRFPMKLVNNNEEASAINKISGDLNILFICFAMLEAHN